MLEIPTDIEQQLREEAALRGQEISEYILWLMDRYESRMGQKAETTQITAPQSMTNEPAK